MFYLIKIITIIFYFQRLGSITVYQCSYFDLLSQQCMLNWTDKIGNSHVSLKICPNSQICKTNKDNSMGFCIDNLKNVLPGEKCKYRSECITNLCIKNKCIGYREHQYCNLKKKDCNPNLSCRLTNENNEIAYRCANLSNINESCELNEHCELNLVCASKKILNELNSYFNVENIAINEIKNYISLNDYKNLTSKKTCIIRASLENGEITDEAMACKSGELIGIEIFPGLKEFICGSKKKIIKDCDLNNKCIVEVDIGNSRIINIEQECKFSTLGKLFCPLKEKENAWKNYLEIYKRYESEENIKEKRNSFKIHIPYDKETLKNGEISEYFWKYNDWIHNIDADECVKQYFFINSKSQTINYELYFLIIFIAFLY